MSPRAFNVDTALGTGSNTNQYVVSGMGHIELMVDRRATYRRFSVITLLEYQGMGRNPNVGRKEPSKTSERGKGTRPIDREDALVRTRPPTSREDCLTDVPLRGVHPV